MGTEIKFYTILQYINLILAHVGCGKITSYQLETILEILRQEYRPKIEAVKELRCFFVNHSIGRTLISPKLDGVENHRYSARNFLQKTAPLAATEHFDLKLADAKNIIEFLADNYPLIHTVGFVIAAKTLD